MENGVTVSWLAGEPPATHRLRACTKKSRVSIPWKVDSFRINKKCTPKFHTGARSKSRAFDNRDKNQGGDVADDATTSHVARARRAPLPRAARALAFDSARIRSSTTSTPRVTPSPTLGRTPTPAAASRLSLPPLAARYRSRDTGVSESASASVVSASPPERSTEPRARFGARAFRPSSTSLGGLRVRAADARRASARPAAATDVRSTVSLRRRGSRALGRNRRHTAETRAATFPGTPLPRPRAPRPFACDAARNARARGRA